MHIYKRTLKNNGFKKKNVQINFRIQKGFNDNFVCYKKHPQHEAKHDLVIVNDLTVTL